MNFLRISVAILAAVLVAGGTASAELVQWTVGEGANGHYYDLVEANGITWEDAQAAVLADYGADAHLATITSQEENDFVLNNLFIFAVANQYWLGGFQPPGLPDDEGWQWVTGEPWDYTNWAPGQPLDAGPFGPEDHLTMNGDPIGMWNDLCTHDAPGIHGYIVEVPEPSGLAMLALGGLAALRRRRR